MVASIEHRSPGVTKTRTTRPRDETLRNILRKVRRQHDPYVFRVDPSTLGIGSVHIVFTRDADRGSRAIHTDLTGQPMPLYDVAATSLVSGIAGAPRMGSRLRAVANRGREVPR
jgi:hypothetical protein